MNGQSSHSSHAPGSDICLRPEASSDEPLLFEPYASTRAQELAMTGWDPAARAAFLELQFRAMRQGYRSMYPQGQFSIILASDAPVGRIVVNRSAAELHVVDIVVSPAQRNRGIGTKVIQALLEEARQANRPVRLQVLKHSRAIAFYRRLRFSRTGETDLYEQMEWRAVNRGG